MTAIRFLVWAGIVGWGLIALNFALAFFLRSPRTLIRFTWCVAAAGAGCFLLSRLVVIDQTVRMLLDVSLAMGGIVCGIAMTVTAIASRGRSLM